MGTTAPSCKIANMYQASSLLLLVSCFPVSSAKGLTRLHHLPHHHPSIRLLHQFTSISLVTTPMAAPVPGLISILMGLPMELLLIPRERDTLEIWAMWRQPVGLQRLTSQTP